MLKLPSAELKRLSLYHLLLKELVPCELSLYILELEFLERKETVFLFYELNVAYEQGMFTQSQNRDKYNRCDRLRAKSVELLQSLEDRYINPVVAYRLYNSMNHNKSKWIRGIAQSLLKSRPVEDLTSEEAYCLAELSPRDADLRLYKLAASKGSTKAMRYVGNEYAYRFKLDDAILYYEEAIALQCPCAMYEFADVLAYFAPTYSRYVELLRQASLLDHQGALERCRREGITSLLS